MIALTHMLECKECISSVPQYLMSNVAVYDILYLFQCKYTEVLIDYLQNTIHVCDHSDVTQSMYSISMVAMFSNKDIQFHSFSYFH